jgi:hypothetical protein
VEDTFLDETSSTPTDSMFFTLSEEGYATILPSGMIVDGVVVAPSGYFVTKNLVRFPSSLPAGTAVSANYTSVQHTDEQVAAAVYDTANNVLYPYFEYAMKFGEGPFPSGVEDESRASLLDVPPDFRSVLAVGAALQMMDVEIQGGAADAILIRDGSTTIDTAVSSQERAKSVNRLVSRWSDLMVNVRRNHSRGGGIYG